MNQFIPRIGQIAKIRPAVMPLASFLLCFCAMVVWQLSATAEPVSREVPDFYYQKLEPLLTPLAAVIDADHEELERGEHGLILLDERLHYVDAQGKRWIVLHRIYKALTEAGIEPVSENFEGYRRSEQRIHLVEAKTIQPDGKQLPVKENAAFIKSPQPDGASSLYTDRNEMVVIFPNIKIGSVTEQITLIEEEQLRMGDEYSATFYPASGWPRVLARLIVDLPDGMAERLQIHSLGHVPAHQTSASGDHRTRLIWEAKQSSGQSYEVRRAPSSDVGPIVWLTTLPDWEGFIEWYAPLMSERSTLSPKLASQVDAWTEDAESNEEIIRILHEKVAANIRYTGLEFGQAGYQPEDCNQVWENQYGDCKDQSNLLRVMLRHKGIDAYLALIDTKHAGRIEKRSPDYRHFNHAIVAIQRPGGDYLFCDPTIDRSQPGVLAPSSADRETLLIKARPEWVKTPDSSAGEMRYSIDLERRNSGELDGWFEVVATGYHAASYADYFLSREPDAVRHAMQDIITDFYPAAEVVDVEIMPAQEWSGDLYQARAYMVVPGDGSNQSHDSLVFPTAGWFVPDLGPRQQRETPYFHWKEAVKLVANIRLPEGWKVEKAPAPYKLDAPAMAASAEWVMTKEGCRAELNLSFEEPLILPDAFDGFYNATLSLRAWLDRPVLLSQDAEVAQTATGSVESRLENFPMMPTGEGQLELLEKRFPDHGDPALRRQALDRIIDYFPKDPETLFNVAVTRALMDWREEAYDVVVTGIREAIAEYEQHVDRETVAWGRYLEACALDKLDQEEEALAIFLEIQADDSLSDFRREWAAVQAGRGLVDEHPQRAIELILDVWPVQGSALAEAAPLLARGRLEAGDRQLLQQDLVQLEAVNIESELQQETASNLAKVAVDLLDGSQPAQGVALLEVLEESELGGLVDETIADARLARASLKASQQIRNELSAYLQENPLDAWAERRPGKEVSAREEYAEVINEAVDENASLAALGYTLELLTKFESDKRSPYWLWRAANFADWHERRSDRVMPLATVLLDFCDQLPRGNDYYHDGRFTRARAMERKADWSGAENVYAELIQMPEFSDEFDVSGFTRWGRALEELGRYEEALEKYQEVESALETSGQAADAQMRAVFLNLQKGEWEEAVRLLSLLEKAGDSVLEEAELEEQIRKMRRLADNPAKARAWWKAAEQWWPDWQELKSNSGLASSDSNVMPVIVYLETLGENLGYALKAKDEQLFWEHFRPVVHAGRWHPEYALEMVGVIPLAYQTSPSLADDLRRFAVTVLEDFPSDDPNFSERASMLRAVHLIDLERDAEALLLLENALQKEPVEPVVWQALLRLRALAILREDADATPAIEALQKLLSSDQTVPDRIVTVVILGQLYRKEGLLDEERQLLERELEHPDVKSDDSGKQQLTARLSALTHDFLATQAFDEAVKDWMEQQDLGWFEYAEPKDLSDPRCRDLEAVLDNPGRSFIEPEQIKLHLLVALDSAQTLRRRIKSLLSAADRLAFVSRTHEDAARLYDPIITNTDLPEVVRAEALWHAFFEAASYDRRSDLSTYTAHPLRKHWNDRQNEVADSLLVFAQADRFKVDEIQLALEKLAKEPLDQYSMDAFRQLFLELLRHGDLEAAETIYRNASALEIDPTAGSSAAALRLAMLKALKPVRAWTPLHQALRKCVQEDDFSIPSEQPEIIEQYRGLSDLHLLSQEQAWDVQLFQIGVGYFPREDFAFWTSVLESLTDVGRQDLSLRLFETALKEAPGDEERAAILNGSVYTFDIDNPEIRATVADLVRPYRDRNQFPLTFSAIRAAEISFALRTGEAIDLETEVERLSERNDFFEKLRIPLRHHLQQRDEVALAALLDSTSIDELLRPSILPLTLASYELLELDAEAELARETAERALYHAVLRSWTFPNAYLVGGVFDLARALDVEPPENWVADVLPSIQHERRRLYREIDAAEAKKDWEAVMRLANKAIEVAPKYYDFYWHLGHAAMKLGQTDEGRAALEIYVRYSKDALEYPRALALLKGAGDRTKE